MSTKGRSRGRISPQRGVLRVVQVVSSRWQAYASSTFPRSSPGRLCTQYLADLGAEVIKIEPIGSGDDTRQWPPFERGAGTVFMSVNRNKKSLADRS